MKKGIMVNERRERGRGGRGGDVCSLDIKRRRSSATQQQPKERNGSFSSWTAEIPSSSSSSSLRLYTGYAHRVRSCSRCQNKLPPIMRSERPRQRPRQSRSLALRRSNLRTLLPPFLRPAREMMRTDAELDVELIGRHPQSDQSQRESRTGRRWQADEYGDVSSISSSIAGSHGSRQS